MPRSPRLHLDGALYHITARGNNREDIFLDRADYLRYLNNLRRFKEKFHFKLYCYALMTNHVHLLLAIDKIPISKIIQVTHTAYTMFFNLKHGHVGHVFQGRFLSLLVEKENYLWELTRYIHLNPVRAGIVTKPQDYPWSSYRNYLSETDDDLIERKEILDFFSKDLQSARQNYHEFVMAGVKKGWKDIGEIIQGSFLGSERFVKNTQRKLKKADLGF